jgi:outer membrane protein assembly factor BamB
VYTGVSSHFVALDQESGDVIWRRDDFGPNDFLPSYASPAAFDEYIIVAFYTQPTNLAVLKAATGEVVWAKTEGKPYHMYSTPVVGEDGTIYTVSGGAVRAFDLETGELEWEIPFTPNRIHATPALAKGRLFVSTGAGTLHALDARSGAEVWRWITGGDGALFTPYVRQGGVTLASPVVAGDYVYVGAANGYLYALDTATGTCVWQHNLKVPLAAPPAISGNGLWIGGCDGFVYAFSTSEN